MFEILKLAATLLGGGLAGALLSEWYRRKHGRLQRIPLIERVNRIVSPTLQGGITLARTVGDPGDRQLVELRNLREYQLTLRNTSTIHLQNVEIQFEFPANNVQEYASPRTTLSKTALMKIASHPTDASAFPSIFRWRIPHFPSGDSVEFTFHAEDPRSESYEVALYNSDRVIVERIEGEPAATGRSSNVKGASLFMAAVMLTAVLTIPLTIWEGHMSKISEDKFNVVRTAGCDLRLVSSYNRYEQDPNTDVRLITNRIFNAGQTCVVKSDALDPKGPFAIGAGETITREKISHSRPTPVETEISVGANDTALQKATVLLYAEP